MSASAGSIAGERRLLVLLAVAVWTLTSCASAESEAAPPVTDQQPSSSPSPSPSPSSFESERHAYHLELPAGWVVAEYGGTWRSLEQFVPGAEVPGEDVASSPGGSGFLVANSMVLPDRMSPADWLRSLARKVNSGLDPGCRLTTDTERIAGERARIIRHRCDGMDIVGRRLTHGGRGYYFTIGFPTGDTATAATLNSIVSSLRFSDQ